jgi:hypothetical protein
MIPLIEAGLRIIDKIIPDPEAKAEATRKLLEIQQAGELAEVEAQLSAIISESKSEDPWTSRARPSFLYVVYIYLLMAIPMGFLFAIYPEIADGVTEGVKQWLHAIPEEIITLFGVGYLGYTGARSLDKRKRQ